MYDSDPFAARKGVEARQEAAAAKKRDESTSQPDSATISNELSGAIEVKMSGGLRDLVEDAIKKVCRVNATFP